MALPIQVPLKKMTVSTKKEGGEAQDPEVLGNEARPEDSDRVVARERRHCERILAEDDHGKHLEDHAYPDGNHGDVQGRGAPGEKGRTMTRSDRRDMMMQIIRVQGIEMTRGMCA